MSKLLASLFVTALVSTNAFAYTVSVEEVSIHEPCVIDCGNIKPGGEKPGGEKPGGNKPSEASASPTPSADGGMTGETTDTGPGPISTGEDPTAPTASQTIDDILGKIERITTLGSKVWDFVITRNPTATYNALKTSVVPEGVTDWQQLVGWNMKPVFKTYRVTYKDLRGKVAGGFDYQISYYYGGNYKGKGKFIGQLAVVPSNISLKTDRSVTFHAEVLDPINFGTVENPIAGIQLRVMYNSPTTLRYTMNTDQFVIYGTGEMQKISP